MDTKTEVLKDYLLRFYPLTEEQLARFQSKVVVKELKPKERLIEEGDVESHVYLIVKGILRKFFRKDEQEIVTKFYKEMDVCHGAVSYFTGLPSAFVIEALEPVVCLAIHRDELDALLDEIPGLEKIFRSVLAELYVKQYNDRMDQMRFSKKERFLNFCENEPELLRRVPQKQLASYLEIAPETFCRMKHVRYKMAKESRLPYSEN